MGKLINRLCVDCVSLHCSYFVFNLERQGRASWHDQSSYGVKCAQELCQSLTHHCKIGKVIDAGWQQRHHFLFCIDRCTYYACVKQSQKSVYLFLFRKDNLTLYYRNVCNLRICFSDACRKEVSNEKERWCMIYINTTYTVCTVELVNVAAKSH